MLVRRMRPTWEIASLAALDAAFLRRERIEGLIWDVDGTLTGDRRPAVAPEVAVPFRDLLALPGIRHVILSNAGEKRYRELGEIFPDVPILRAYDHAGTLLYRRVHRGADSWTPEELTRRAEAGARVIRKPSAVLVDYAVSELGCGREAVVMVGDQYLTDVAGASLAGVRSVKLPTLAPESFRLSVRLSQRLEQLTYAIFHSRRR